MNRLLKVTKTRYKKSVVYNYILSNHTVYLSVIIRFKMSTFMRQTIFSRRMMCHLSEQRVIFHQLIQLNGAPSNYFQITHDN